MVTGPQFVKHTSLFIVSMITEISTLEATFSVNKRKEKENVKFYDEVLHKFVAFGTYA